MDERSKFWHLEQFNLFEGLPKSELMKVSEQVVDRTARRGEYIYFPDDQSQSVYFLKKGRIKIGNHGPEGRENIKVIMNPGELFGELAMAGEERREEFAQALEDDTLICALSQEDMETVLKRNPQLSLRITRLLGFRLRRMERRLKDLIFKDARTRIIDFIREMAREKGQKVGTETLIRHKLTHQDIASLTGSSRQTVTTVLNELRERNLINFERKRILIRDIEKLI